MDNFGEAWREVLRKAFFPLFSTPCLEMLMNGLIEDDPLLLQVATCSPPPLACLSDWPVEAGCLVVYPMWKIGQLPTIGHAALFFAHICAEMDQLLNEIAGARWLLNWFDDAPRDEMRRGLAPEVGLEIGRREKENACSGSN